MKFSDLLQNLEYKNDKTLSPCGRADTTVLLYKDPGLYNQYAFIQQFSAECLLSVRQWTLSGPWKKCTSGLLESCPPVRCLMSSTPMVPCLPLLVMQFCWVAVGLSLHPRDAWPELIHGCRFLGFSFLLEALISLPTTLFSLLDPQGPDKHPLGLPVRLYLELLSFIVIHFLIVMYF